MRARKVSEVRAWRLLRLWWMRRNAAQPAKQGGHKSPQPVHSQPTGTNQLFR